MSYGALEKLLGEDFDLPLSFYSTPNSLRRQLLHSKEVKAVREAIGNGTLTENTVRLLVDCLLRDLKKGERFPYESALAGLAVAIEGRFTDFSESYLRTLASLQLVEMTLSIGVAILCLQNRPSKAITLDLGPHEEEEIAGQLEIPHCRWFSSPAAEVVGADVAEEQHETPEAALGMVPLPGCRCRCGHEWLPRDAERPRVCPKCKSPNWDRPKLWTGKRPKADQETS